VSLHLFTGIFAGVGVAAVFGLITHRISGATPPLPARALVALGRRSLSGYLAQSLIFVPVLAENETCQRPRCQDRVAERIRAVPASTLRASVRVDSPVRTTPIRGSRTCRRSWASPNEPVENRHDSRARRLALNRGIRARPALRLPSAAARLAQPVA